MAGFAVNIEFLLKFPNATMPFKAGYEEDMFLRSLGISLDEIEPKADDCTEVNTLFLYCYFLYKVKLKNCTNLVF